MMKTQAPAYIYRGGGMMERPPFQMQNTRFYGFFVKGDCIKMQSTVDREINAVARDHCYFKVISDHVMLSFADIKHTYSKNPIDYQKGFGEEIDVCFWIPVGKVSDKNGKALVHEVFWYCSYIWVDSPIAMVAGRDIYGYPKTMGEFEFPKPESPNHFKLSVNSFKTFSPETEAAWNHVLSVDNLTSSPAQDHRWHDFVDAMKGLWDVMDDALFDPELQATEQMLELLLKPQLPQLFLKQFPDEFGNKAVYQALVSAPAKVNQFSGGGLLAGNYQLTLNQVDSIPISRDLGIPTGATPLAFGFWLDYGFSVSDGKVLVDNTRIPPKQKIAVLGGGVSSCVSAFALSDQPGWQDRYDITVYQQGWRIGGKGASGRNDKVGQRIEEHGLHIWLGFYENAFRVMQAAYRELDRPEGAPLRTWQDAFKAQNFIVLMEQIEGKWQPWCIDFPEKPDLPGQGEEVLDAWQIMEVLYAWLKKLVCELTDAVEQVESGRVRSRASGNFFSRLAQLADRLEDDIEDAFEDVLKLVNGLSQFVATLPRNLSMHSDSDHSFLDSILDDIKAWLEDIVDDYLDSHDELRRLYVSIDLAMAILTGMHRDKIHKRGFDIINDLDLRQWLAINGASEIYTVNSAPIRGIYDLVFAYKNGDIHQPNLEAGTGLRGMLLLALAYKGSIMWKMQAGMGDVVFTPFYQVLKKRGVKFRFFHQVQKLTLDDVDNSRVEKITLTRQVPLAAGADHYEPLVYVKGLACWPSAPRYDQLLPSVAEILQNHHIDLECFWSNWPEVYRQETGQDLPEVVLERGKDFDQIVFGISVASLPFLCEELLAVSPALKACSDNLNTVVTQAYQLWTTKNLRGLGWDNYPPSGQDPILTAFTEPVDTWAAMNQLLIREDWQGFSTEPHNCAYYCGVQAVTDFPPQTDYDFPDLCRAKVKAAAIAQLNNDMKALWPKAVEDGHFRWEWLYDTESRVGEARFDGQYWRSNISPSERYVLSSVNTSRYRVEPDGVGFSNIYFTGDWIKNGINAGCVEAATIAGLKTARAISGYPKVISGEGKVW